MGEQDLEKETVKTQESFMKYASLAFFIFATIIALLASQTPNSNSINTIKNTYVTSGSNIIPKNIPISPLNDIKLEQKNHKRTVPTHSPTSSHSSPKSSP